MIHLVTVHWRSDRWIDPQRHFISRYVEEPYRLYAFLNEVPGDQAHKFFYSSAEPIEDHATKLDLLADVVRLSASDASDVLVFVDGDAFPIAPLAPLVEARLGKHQLIAVRRYENNGDLQPHPCFCVTTVGFWTEMGSDWHRGHSWRDLDGNLVTDVGGNLLYALEQQGVDWYPLHRINKTNPHPVFFAVYGDEEHRGVVYHHGAAFRQGLTRADFREGALADAERRIHGRLLRRLPRRGVLGAAQTRYDPLRRAKLERQRAVRIRSDRITSRIDRGEEFWHDLMNETQPIHVLHIGKTGGTALKHALLDHRSVSGYELLLHGHDVTLEQIPAGERFMFVIRDPLSRFVSAFNGRLREDRPRYHYPWNGEERIAFRLFKTPDELGAALSSSDHKKRRQAERAMRGIGHLSASYQRWLGDERTFRSRLADLFFIGFQDHLTADFEQLKRKLGLPSDLQLPSDAIEAHRTPRGYDASLGPVARANLERWYASDLEFVQLCRELAQSVNGA
jgi:hypothetical protein